MRVICHLIYTFFFKLAGRLLDFIFAPIVWFLFKTRELQIYLAANLTKNAKVLDVGSGHNPWFRSDVLLERYPLDNTERSGDMKTRGKEIIIGDACKMPFDDKSFDFIYASHVAEHIEDIASFFDELQRVGKAGYIETPNAAFEQTIGTTTHLWALWVDNGILHAERKWVTAAPKQHYDTFHGALHRHPLFYFCFLCFPDLRPMSFYWNNNFKYVIHEAPGPSTPTRASD